MASFDDCTVKIILDHEVGNHPDGGLVDNPADPGGVTKWGISLNFVQNIWPLCAAAGATVPFPVEPTRDFIVNLAQDQAVALYKACWWDLLGLWRLWDQRVATKVLDMAVNMGPPSRSSATKGQAFVMLQRAVGAADDGDMGPRTVAAANSRDPDDVLRDVCRQQAAFYQHLVDQNPAKGVFLKGWLARAAWPFDKIP